MSVSPKSQQCPGGVTISQNGDSSSRQSTVVFTDADSDHGLVCKASNLSISTLEDARLRDSMLARRLTADASSDYPMSLEYVGSLDGMKAASSKTRMIEQKRAEHEYARLEHRRRFEEEMMLMEMKQQRDEELLLGVDEESVPDLQPVTPSKIFMPSDARGRASTLSKISSVQGYEQRVSFNDQLATPPSDHSSRGISRSSPNALTMKSVPGLRRHSASLNMNTDTAQHRKSSERSLEPKRVSQLDGLRTFSNGKGSLDSSHPARGLYGDEGTHAKSYLQMNTTDDSFPILVRRDSFPGMTMVDGDLPGTTNTTYRRSLSTLSLGPQGSLPGIASARNSISHNLTPPGPFNELADTSLISTSSNARNMEYTSQVPRLQSSFSTSDIPTIAPSGVFNDSRDSSLLLDRRRLASRGPLSSSISPASGQSPLGSLSIISSNIVSPMPSPGPYGPYGLMPSPYQTHQYGSYPFYSANQVQHQLAPRNSVFKRNIDEAGNRFADVSLDSLIGDIYSLCKDQHGCRYLQKKLDERNATYVDIIFAETYLYSIELMTDPFGNYLCQKLLEHSNDEQRLKIVQAVAPDLVTISLNMHGTRAVQKMIEFLSTAEQIDITTNALNTDVVTLIKDLNGNHVIQKCLNRLSNDHFQFIFDAVSSKCVEVATHRHGCCVLQRCIDHASGAQKTQIISEITYHALTLVQDPFGNYVVQYVLDLGDTRLSDPLIRRFVGSFCLLSVQKFSSNVMEKCLRVAEPQTRNVLVDELLHKARLEKLLRDSYANYVIQTAIDYADAIQRQQLIECIRPLLPAIRSTPYGRRIQSKINGTSGVNLGEFTNVGRTGFELPNYSLMNMNGAHAFPGAFRGEYQGYPF